MIRLPLPERFRAYILLAVCGCFAACDTILPPPTLTPTIEISGPTIEASATLDLRQPTNVSFDAVVETSNPTVAALAPDSVVPPVVVGTPPANSLGAPVIVTAQDGTLLNGTFYQQADGIRRPGVLMIGPDINAWGDLPVRIFNANFTVLVMPLRQENAQADFTVMLQALTSGDADPARLAVIGAAEGADATLIGCSSDQLCDTAILLSPSTNPIIEQAMGAFSPRPILLVASQDDAVSSPAVQVLQGLNRGEVLVQPFASAGRGTEILANRPDLIDLMVAWLQRQIGG
ncbi:MAG: hypothetical protein LCI00_26860 [Chloroflexi bacterium]|nr:hypothetical protein [Chloroflexota bacterium]MCC6893964.1 hypothetical protein [Anaerolineae bacterium]